jgi:hypothetical protein
MATVESNEEVVAQIERVMQWVYEEESRGALGTGEECRGKERRRLRKGKRTRDGWKWKSGRATTVLREVPENESRAKAEARSEWDELMSEVDELVCRGQLSKSQAAMAGLDEEPVMEQVRKRRGQEQMWTWNDPSRQVEWKEMGIGVGSETI